MEKRDLPSFIAPISYDTGAGPASVAAGDFTGNGIADLVTANSESNTVSVLLGQGDGSFQPARSFAVGNDPVSVVVGDFTGDGILDLAVANLGTYPSYTDASISVLLGTGDGTFRAAYNLPLNDQPESLAVGDFNGDGIPDLVIANALSNTVSVLLGAGNGTFHAARTFAAGSGPSAVAVGDFNGDGIQDLAVADYASFGGTPGVSMLLGNGDGSFRNAVSYAAGPSPDSVAVGDFNGDGIPDLAVANDVISSGTVSVLLGTGDGTFQDAVSYPAGPSPTAVAVGDFNGDGIQDLAVADLGDGGNKGVSVLLGTGDGSFQPPRTFATATSFFGQAVAVGDFNGDGVPDLAVTDSSNNSVNVLLGTGDGSFQGATNFIAGIGGAVAVGDFNGDGILDLAVANEGSDNVNILLGNGDGSFQPPRSYLDGGYGSMSLAVADLTGDGILDLIVANRGSNDVSVLLGTGDGTFQHPRTFAAGDEPFSVAVGDFTGNGILDLAVADSAVDRGTPGVSVLLGNGDGTFQPARTFAAGIFPDAVAVGDFTGNGIPDLAVADYGDPQGNGQGVSVLLGNGDGTFQAPRTFSAGSRPESLVVGDFSGDGLPDLTVMDGGTPQGHGAGVSVLLGEGGGTFRAAVNYAAGVGPTALAVGDFNRDGIPDLVVANYPGGARVLLGNGDGTFQLAPISYLGGPGPVAVAVGDFTGDGRADLALATDGINPSISILLNDGNWPARPRSTPRRRADRGHTASQPAARSYLATVLIPTANAPLHRGGISGGISAAAWLEPALPTSPIEAPHSSGTTDTPAAQARPDARHRLTPQSVCRWDPASADLDLLDQALTPLV